MSEKVWVIDDDDSIRWVLEKAFQKSGLDVKTFDTPIPVLEKLKKEKPNTILTDIRMPKIDGLSFMKELSEKYPEIPVIIMTAHSDLDSAVNSFEGGAFDYLPKPFDVEEAVVLVRRACQSNMLSINTPDIEANNLSIEIIGSAPAMQEVFRIIGRLSKFNVTVLINGESGTGKELVALALHKHSPRKNKPFIALNMAAIPKDLMEAELFGHEKGAFTGANQKRKGRFEQADKGTLFLDEIGDMSSELQTRLLRVLSDGQFYRVGGHDPVKVDVRIVAATHQNLEELVKKGRFREDLFHRLNVIRIQVPPLRERKEDIETLLTFFLAKISAETGETFKTVSQEVLDYLKQLSWPGNVRQLENLARWITVMSAGEEVQLDDLPPDVMEQKSDQTILGGDWKQALEAKMMLMLSDGQKKISQKIISDVEKILIKTSLQKTKNKKSDAAEILGWGRNTLTRKIKELGIK